jgi:pimeloyl-ACP methyl ester carboxylesterase
MSGVRRQPKRLFIIAIFVCIFLIMLGLYRSMMPRLGAEQSCDTSSDGESIAINGHIMWIKVLNRESKATPIYVLGGGPGFSTNYLEKSLRFLAKDHPVIFFDGRCSGRSEYTADLSDCTFQNYAKDLEVLRSRLTPDRKIIILSHSSGAITAMAYADAYWNQLQGMIFISPVGYKTKVKYSDEYLHTGFPPFNQKYANVWFETNLDQLYGKYFANKEVEGVLKDIRVNYALMMKNEGKDHYNYKHSLRQIQVPTLIISGGKRETPITGSKESKKLAELIAGSTYYRFNHSGHFSFAEEPQHFKRVVNQFMAQFF